MLQNPQNGDRVWVSILPKRQAGEDRRAGVVQPVALAPAVVTDSRVMNREIIRGDGPRLIQNSVEAISYNKLDDGREFYREQAQGLIGLSPRGTYIPAIDGPKDVPLSVGWHRELVQKVAESTNTLVAAPSHDVLAEAEAKYSEAKRDKVSA